MTAYAATFLWTSTTAQKLSLVPSAPFQVRVARIEVSGAVTSTAAPGQTLQYQVLVYPSNAASAGSTITPLPMAGGPAASAVARTNPTISGTSYALHGEAVGGSVADPSTGIGAPATMNSNYTFPFELILSSGSTILIAAQNSGNFVSPPTTAVIYFEEIRTPRTL